MQKRDKKWLTTEKPKSQRMMRVEAKAKQTKGVDGIGWNVTDLDAVLTWYNHPKRSTFTNKKEKMNGWNKLRAKGLKESAACAPWKDEEERMLHIVLKIVVACLFIAWCGSISSQNLPNQT